MISVRTRKRKRKPDDSFHFKGITKLTTDQAQLLRGANPTPPHRIFMKLEKYAETVGTGGLINIKL